MNPRRATHARDLDAWKNNEVGVLCRCLHQIDPGTAIVIRYSYTRQPLLYGRSDNHLCCYALVSETSRLGRMKMKIELTEP
jgi:hypothetical protein